MTHVNKIFSIFTAGLVAAILVTSNFAHGANLDQATSSLPSDEEWSIMAHAAVNQTTGQSFLRSPISGSATDIEKRILAITAIGENPRTYGSEDLIGKLEAMFDGSQIGDASLLNDDIFGMLALESAAISDNVVSKSREFILSHENSDGGWGFGTNVGSDSNTTAMAIAALSLSGGAPGGAFDYISKTQDSSGGYGFMPGTPADGASTAWVIMGYNIAGRGAPSSATAFLDSLQVSGGLFKWKPNDGTGSMLVTAYAVIALSGHGVPVRTISATNPTNPPPPPPQTPTPTPDTPMPPPPPPPVNPTTTTATNTGNSDLNLIGKCLVPVFHTNFAFPPEGGKIVKIDGQLYFVKTYEKGCENAGNNGTPVAPGSDPPAQTTLTPSASANTRPSLIGKCLVPVFHTNFAFPPEGGKIVKIDGQLYFVKTYEKGCENAGSEGTPVVHANDGQQSSPNQTTTSVPSTTSTRSINLKITYNSTNLFQGTVSLPTTGLTPLQALITAASQNNLALNVRQTSLGSFVSSIGGYGPSGSSGWQYAVNGSVPAVSASNYVLQNQDSVSWFYGPPGTNPY